jgi:Flp pilus assembly protein TadG
MRATNRSRRSGERGATAVIVAIVLAVLCGFVALSLDVGHLFSARGELQNGADAGALAGAQRLTGRNVSGELAEARADAEAFARKHPTDSWDVEPTTVQLGAWLPPERGCGEVSGTQVGPTNADDYKFCAIAGTSEVNASNINAVRVVTQRVGTPGSTGGGAVQLAFGGFVGQSGPKAVAAEAIAVSGGPCTEDCAELPIAIRRGCLFNGGEIRCDEAGVGPTFVVGLSNANVDSAGLTSFMQDEASASGICDVVRRNGTCNAPINAGTEVMIKEGTSWNSACTQGCSARTYNQNLGAEGARPNDSVCEALRKMADADCNGELDVDDEGRPANRGKVPVLQYPGEATDACGGHYNGVATIVGWATIGIVSVRCEGDGSSVNQLPSGQEPITALCDQFFQSGVSFSGSTCVVLQMFCDEEDDDANPAGCGWYGTGPLQPTLVR